MGNRGKQYIESVISRIKWKNYHPAIRSELENHMEDGVSELLLEGKTVEEALNITIENMGDPVVLGMQLDEVYKPQYDLRKILMFFLFLFSFSLLKVFALPRMCGEYFSLLLAVCRVVLGSFASLMVFKSDWSNNKKRKSFALIVFWSFIILCILLPLSGFVEKERVIQGILVLLPSCVCFFADRMKEKEELGVFLCVCLFAVPIILSIYSHSFSALLILSLESVIILVFTIKSNWIITRKSPSRMGLCYFRT